MRYVKTTKTLTQFYLHLMNEIMNMKYWYKRRWRKKYYWWR